MSADGTWNTTVNSPMGAQKATLTIKTEGATFTGTMAGPQGEQPVSGKVDGDTLTWGSKLTQPFPIDLEFTVKVEGDKMTGSVKAGAFGSSPLTGERA
jgi:hypothetical protein